MVIRPLRSADRPSIAALQAASWRDAYVGVLPDAFLEHEIDAVFADYWRRVEIGPEDLILVAEEAGLLGFIAVWRRPDAYIDNLHVRPDRRSSGIGLALMQAAARQLVDQGHRTAYLLVVASNVRAIQFYERLGGVATERSTKQLFGHTVETVRIQWSDIGSIYGR